MFIDDIKNIEIKYVENDLQRHIVDTIGSVDDLIEKNDEIMKSFQIYLQSVYRSFLNSTSNYIELGDLIIKSGKQLKNREWKDAEVVDLSSMPQDKICITSATNGSQFSTNIYTLEDDTLLYGSIRPYFKKCGFTVGRQYVTGTVHTFKAIQKELTTYVLAIISSSDFHNFTNVNSQGTKMPSIKWDVFTKFSAPLLSDSSMKEFCEMTYPLYEKMKLAISSNIELNNIKKLLLFKYFN